MSMASPERPRVVIVGAGFGGLWAARALARASVGVLVLDRNNYHTFLPLLYQVAAAEVEPESIVYPVRTILRRQANARFYMSEVTAIDLEARQIKTAHHIFSYDYLILAAGSTSHFFSVDGASEFAFPLKTLEDGIALRNHILYCFERAMFESDPAFQKRMLTFSIVGGGPTGIEFAGALAELIRGPLARDYPGLDLRAVSILLLEATEHLLPGWPERLQRYAEMRLRRMGVDVRTGKVVSAVTGESLTLKDGTIIPTETVIWTAGVRGVDVETDRDIPLTRQARVEVLPTLQLPGYPQVYVIGDLAYREDADGPLPMIAPVAIQQGEAAAKNILRQINGDHPEAFVYRDPGSMVTIGRNAAVVRLGNYSFIGFPAWVVWLAVHLYKLIGFRNRLLVLLGWAWDYLFFERSVRLIFPVPKPLNPDCLS